MDILYMILAGIGALTVFSGALMVYLACSYSAYARNAHKHSKQARERMTGIRK